MARPAGTATIKIVPMPKINREPKRLPSQAGVTLLELLVVLMILASITAAIAVPIANRAPSQAEQMAELNSVLSNARWQARQTQSVVLVAANQTPEAQHTLPEFVRFAGSQDERITYFSDGSTRGPDVLINDQVFSVDLVTGALHAQ